MKAPRYKWQPTTAEIAAKAGITTSDVVRFDHNTSPFGTEWAIPVAQRALSGLNEYPGADYRGLRQAAARFTGLEPEQIVPGAGADELILLAGRAYLGRGRTAVATIPTYPLYEISTLQAGAEFYPVPATGPDFALPGGKLIRAARDADVVWICTPNNPTGNPIGDRDLEAIVAATDGLVIIDAAYAEFASSDWSARVERHHNLLVLRTLSKAFGIAGARVGYAMAHPDIISELDGVRPPGSISSVSADLAIAALTAPDRMDDTVAAIVAERTRLAASLAQLGLRVLPSQTNFLLCEVGENAPTVAAQLMGGGLVARKFPAAGPLEAYLRFTVRNAGDNDRLLDALERYLP